MRSDINTTKNIIKVLGMGIEREVVLQSETTLYPGCIVVPFGGTVPPVEGFDGSTGNVHAPNTVGNLPIAVVNTTSANGRSLTTEYNQGDQIPVWFPERGAKANVRIDSAAVVTKGTYLTVVPDGSGFVIPGTQADAIGVADEDITVLDPELPTLIVMEVF